MFSGWGTLGKTAADVEVAISAGALVAIATINAGKYCSQNDEK